jgi:hypothetical protein
VNDSDVDCSWATINKIGNKYISGDEGRARKLHLCLARETQVREQICQGVPKKIMPLVDSAGFAGEGMVPEPILELPASAAELGEG